MNSRNLLLAGAVLLLGAGLVLTVRDLLADEAPTPTMVPALAASAIAPYTIITQEMVLAGEDMPVQMANSQGAWRLTDVVGKMSAAQIQPGDLLTGVRVKPIEEVRFVEDLGLEIVSFSAGIDRLVGGQLRPGHLVNLYGNGRDPLNNEPYTELIEPRIWVVEVAAGGQPNQFATPRPGSDGIYREEVSRNEPAGTLITVAVEPKRAYHIIDALGAKGLQAWVTLAASGDTAFAARPTATPAAVALPTVDAMATLQAIVGALPTSEVEMPVGGYGGAAGH
jgi:hypothetical protein